MPQDDNFGRKNLLTGPEWEDDQVSTQTDNQIATPVSRQQAVPQQRPNLLREMFPDEQSPQQTDQPILPQAVPPQQQQVDQPAQQGQQRPRYLLETVSAEPLQEIESKGFVGDVGSALGRGVAQAVEMTGRGLEEIGVEDVGGFLREKGEAVKESEFLAPDWEEAAGRDGFVKRSVIGAAESFPTSLVPFMTAAAGGLVGGHAGAIVGGAAGLGTVIGGGTYSAEKERATEAFQKQHPDWAPEQIESEAHQFAKNQALWEVVTEGASELVTFGIGKVLAANVAKQGAKVAAPTLKSLLGLGPKEFAKVIGKQYLAEGGSELIAYLGQAENERAYGLGEGPDLQGALDTAAVSFWMTGIMGGGMLALNNRAKRRVMNNLQSDNLVMRRHGLNQIEAGITKQYGPERASEWRQYADAVIEAGEQFDFNAPIFQAAQEPVQVEDAQKGVLEKALAAVPATGVEEAVAQAPATGVEEAVAQAPVPGAEAVAQAPVPGAEVVAATPVPGAEVVAATPVPGAEVAAAVPVPGAEVVAATPVPGAEVAAAVHVPGAEVAAAAPVPVPTKKTGTRIIKPGIGKEGERTTLGTMTPKEFQESHRDIKKMSTITSNKGYKKALPRKTERIMNKAADLKEQTNDLEASVLRNKKHLVSLFERAGKDNIRVEFDGRAYEIKKPSVTKDEPYISHVGRRKIADLWVRMANEGLVDIDPKSGERMLKIQTVRPGKATVARFGPKTLDAAAIEHLSLQKKLGEKAEELNVVRGIIDSDIIPNLQDAGIGHTWKSLNEKASFNVARKGAEKEFLTKEAPAVFEKEKAKIAEKHTKPGKDKYGTAGVSPGQAQGFVGKGAKLKRAEFKAKTKADIYISLDEDGLQPIASRTAKKQQSRQQGRAKKMKVSAISSKHSKLANIVADWLAPLEKRLGHNVDVGLLSFEDFREGINVPANLEAKAKMMPALRTKKSINGFAYNDGHQHIIVLPDLSGMPKRDALKIISTLSHEVGHIIEKEFLYSAPKSTQEAIINAHAEWVRKTKPKVMKGRVAKRERKPAAQIFDIGKRKFNFKVDSTTATGQPYAEYLLSFEEWFADQVAKAITTDKKAIGVVEEFFTDLAKMMKILVGKIAGTKYMPDKVVADFVLGKDITGMTVGIGGETDIGDISLQEDISLPSDTTDRVENVISDTQGSVTDQDIADHLAGKGKETKGQYASRQFKSMQREFGDASRKILGKISSEIRKYSPEVAARLRKMEIDIFSQTKHYTDRVEKLMAVAKSKMSDSDYKTWKFLLLNHDQGRIESLTGKYGINNEYQEAKAVLKEMNQELSDAGIPDEDLHKLWPRMIKDESGLLQHLERGDMRPVFTDAVEAKARKLGFDSASEMPDDVRAKVYTSVILHGQYGKKRIAEEEQWSKVPNELQQYFYDPDAAMVKYIRESVLTNEYRKFFGTAYENIGKAKKTLERIKSQLSGKKELLPSMKKELEGEARELEEMILRNANSDFTDRIGILIDELVQKEGLDPRGQKVIYDALYARFHEKGPHGIFNTYKNLSLIDTMGSFISAITQIGDFGFTLYDTGVFETARAARKAAKAEVLRIGKKAGIYKGKLPDEMRMTTEEAGLETLVEEFADSGKIGHLVNTVFKLTGLDSMNRIARDTALNAELAKFEKEAKNNPAALRKKIKPMFGKETQSVIEDLLAGEVTDNVNYLVISRLMDFQPIAKSEMPAGYLLGGNGRLFYSLKSYTISQLNTYREEVFRKLRSSDKQERIQGMKNMFRISFFLVLANASADELKDFILGREVDWQDRVTENILRLGGINRFVTWQARREGVGSALAKQILPPFKLIDAFSKDITTAGDGKGLKMLDSVPLIGKPLFWRMGRGTLMKDDIWDIRYSREKKRLEKVNDRLERAGDKMKFRARNRSDLRELAAMRSFQSALNRNRRQQNLLEAKEPTVTIDERLDRLRDLRREMIRKFLGRS